MRRSTLPLVPLLAALLACSRTDQTRPSSESRGAAVPLGQSGPGEAVAPPVGNKNGEPQFAPVWVAHCDSVSPLDHVTFRSLSGDWTNDDMVVHLVWTSGDSTTVPMRPGLFKTTRLRSSDVSACRGVAALSVGTGLLLLLVHRDDRPADDRLSLLLVDLHDRTVPTIIDDLGEAYDFDKVGVFVLRRGPGVFHVLMVRDWIDDHLGSAWGAPVPDWLVVEVLQDHASAHWRS